MIDVIAPMQFMPMKTVLEQDNKFRLIVTATLGINLSNNETLLTFDYIKDSLECMGDKPLFDLGMPKPTGEYLVSGSFYAPNGAAVEAGEVKVKLGEQEKSLYVFGPRTWQMGIPSKPKPISHLRLDFSSSFGGENFPENPDGIGYNQDILPQIESPKDLVSSASAYAEPACFTALDPFNPKRAQYLGTYDNSYLEKYFPGYPADLDWRAFMCAQKNQWAKDFYQGDESFELHNMHPEEPVIKGSLPNLVSRCFVKKTESDRCEEIPLNIDTVWFFPEKKMALLISRGGIDVKDDEAEEYSHLLLAYERKEEARRTLDYYQNALQRRLNSSDRMLHNLCTEDLIPDDHKSAMELLQIMAENATASEEFVNNLEAKKQSVQALVDEKTEEALKVSEAQLAAANLPADQRPNIRDMLIPTKESSEVESLNNKLEKVLPGITGKDGQKLDLKNFSFDKIDEITAITKTFSEEKNISAKAELKIELEKSKKVILEQLQSKNLSSEAKSELEKALEMINNLINEEPIKAVLPRINAEAMILDFKKSSPDIEESIKQLMVLQDAGADANELKKLEKQLREQEKLKNNEIETQFKQAELDFKKGYLLAAHGMEDGLSPHEESLTDLKRRILKRVSLGESLSNQDLACLDLSGENLEGVDFSGAYLEQVNFTGAKLKGANFSGSILARAIFDKSDCRGVNFDHANVGSVKAHQTDFSESTFKGSELSESDFTGANFSAAHIENVNALNVIVKGANFSYAQLPKILFLDISLDNVDFTGAHLDSAVFLNSTLQDVVFTKSIMNKCVFTDIPFSRVKFDESDLTGSCFVSTEPGKSRMLETSFIKARLNKCNLQSMSMPNSNLTGASLENSSFMGADLTGSNLTGVNAKGATFRKAKLDNAVFKNANLMETSLSKTKLVGTTFVGANLFSADFLRSTIKDTDFSASNLDGTLIKDWRPS